MSPHRGHACVFRSKATGGEKIASLAGRQAAAVARIAEILETALGPIPA